MDYHVHIDFGEDEGENTVRVTEEGKEKVLLAFQFTHPINSRLVKDARREAMKRMAER